MPSDDEFHVRSLVHDIINDDEHDFTQRELLAALVAKIRDERAEKLRRANETYIDKLLQVFIVGLRLFLVAIAAFTCAVFLHSVFVDRFLPPPEIARPLHFRGRSASAQLGESLGQGQRPLSPSQEYHVSVKLRVSESADEDEALRPFQACIRFMNVDGEPTKGSSNPKFNHLSFEAEDGFFCRPTTKRRRSRFLRDLSAFADFIQSGAEDAEEAQNVEVVLDAAFKDSIEVPAFSVEVDIRGDGLEAAFRSAEVVVRTEYRGISYFLHYYPYLSATVSITINFCFILSILMSALIFKLIFQ